MGLKARKMITNYTVKTFPAAVTLVFHFPVSPTFFDLLREEPEPSVRVVLGHFIFHTNRSFVVLLKENMKPHLNDIRTSLVHGRVFTILKIGPDIVDHYPGIGTKIPV